jgi:hypothetical protein
VRSAVSICLASAFLTACQTYEPAPLGERPELLSDVAALTISPSDLPLPELGAHRFDPSAPLDMDEIAMIAVVNNPDLKAMRGQLGVAEAQAFAAGLLPNPQFSFAATRQTFGWPCAGRGFAAHSAGWPIRFCGYWARPGFARPGVSTLSIRSPAVLNG